MTNTQIEQSILGAILLEENMSFIQADVLSLQHFSQQNHQVIFSFMLKLHKENKPIDILSMMEELRKHNELEAIGGASYLSSLTTIVTTTSNTSHYIEILKELALKRKLLMHLAELTNNMEQYNSNQLLQELEYSQKIVQNSQKCDDLICDFSQIKQETLPLCLKTGFEQLDKVTHGLEYGTLSILTGEPGSGKSTILNQMIANILSERQNVFLYSGEFSQSKIKNWFAHTLATEQDLEEYQNEFYESKIKPTNSFMKILDIWIKEKLFLLKDSEQLNKDNIITIIRYLATEKNIRCFVFDNLMTLIANENEGDTFYKQKYFTNLLKKAAKELDVVIILVAHPNKESSKSFAPSMFDVAGVSEIVNLADYVFKLIKEEDQSFFYVLKNRIEGITDVYLKLFFDKKRRRFYSKDGRELDKNFL